MEKAAYIIYLIILLLCILMFGAVHTYMYTLMSLGVLTAATLLLLKGIRKDYQSNEYRLRLPRNSLHVGFVALLTFLIFQTLPMPDPVLTLLSPEAAVVARKSLPTAETLADGLVNGTWFSLAPYVYPVRMSIVRFVVYGFFFFGLFQTLQSRRRINVAVSLLLAMGCFEALYALMETYSGSHHVLWYRMDYAKERLKGTYINGNHFAGFMAMGVILAAAFAGALAPMKRPNQGNTEKKQRPASRFASFLEGQESLSKRILVGFAGVVMGIGLIFSASRGAIISWAGAMFLMGVLFVVRKSYRQKGIIFIGLFVLICAYAIEIGVDYPLERFMQIESGIESRSRYAAKTMDLFEDFKAVGAGVGNFPYAFPKYQSAKDKKKFYRYAHNDWAQYLAEAGIAGLGLLLVGLGVYVFKTLSLWKQRKDPYAVSLGVVPVAVIAYMAIHSYSEFNLHTPANALILAAIMAIGYAALHLERHHRRDRMSYTYYDLPLRYRGGVALVAILGLIGWSGWWSIRHFAAEAYCNTVPNSTLNRDRHPPVAEVVKAIEWDGGNAEYWYKLGEAIEAQSGEGREAQSGEGREAQSSKLKGGREDAGVEALSSMLKAKSKAGKGAGENGSEFRVPSSALRLLTLERAVRLNPFEAQYHLQLGWAYAHQWQEADYHAKWLPAADISMERAAYFAGVKNPRLHVELGNYWVMRSKSVYPSDPLHHEAWAKAVWHYRKAQGIEGPGSKAAKEMRKEIRGYVWNVYPDEEFVARTMAEGMR
ncbi:MAG: O-antigen ligase family protein [Deltaproteobacteria bacterium]|nr:O-antigen ligase family protein [Deltaproteobacteria bacterium]